jgi:tetratricopeptide (TPR) repeat protein
VRDQADAEPLSSPEGARVELTDPYGRVDELSSERRYDEAIEILHQVLSANPADVDALTRKAALLHTAGRYPQAKAVLAEALSLDPQNVGALQTLAYTENALGDPERSLSLFRQLASLKGFDEQLARMIGNQLWALDEKSRDSTVYQDFEEGCPPIEQVIAQIDGGAFGGAESVGQLARQIAAQTAVLGRIRSWEESHEYFLVQHRFRNMALHSYRGTRFKPPEEPAPKIPEPLRNAFSMSGRIELLQGYINSVVPPECTEGIDDDAVRTFLALNYEALPSNAKPEAARIVKDFVPSQHPQTTKAFARGSMPFPEIELADKSVAVVASHDCCLDATLICLCREVTSVRLRNINGSTELFRTAILFDWLREDTQYDVIICPLILESWGLGRHGEPLDPGGDIALMERFREKLRPGGSCYIRLPVGRDRLIFNAMRIYGAHRLAAILEGWSPKSAEQIKPDRLAARVSVRENFLLEPDGPSSRRSPSAARELHEYAAEARVIGRDRPSPAGAGASLRGLMDKLKAEAMAQAEQIAILRAQLESLHMDFSTLMLAEYQLNRQTFGPPNPCPTPPLEIPPHLLDAFTMGGIAKVEPVPSDSTYPSNWPLIYTDIEIDYYLRRINQRKWFLYGTVDLWIWEAIAKYPIAGLSVVNMGSITPWYESICLYYGASSTTIDYNKIITLTDRIKTMTVADWDREQPRFDVAWSISSFEHDGLGMYGDPLDPDGDLKAMQKMKRIVKPGGLMFFAIPVGREDKILYNLQRIYGPVRLKKVLEGWEVLESYGVHPPGAHVQPLFILRNI